jgi:hypothetical protein
MCILLNTTISERITTLSLILTNNYQPTPLDLRHCFEKNITTSRFYIERRIITESLPIIRDIAYTLYAYLPDGKIVIAANRPLSLLSPLRREWLKLIRQLQIKRSSTLNAKHIIQLSEQLTKMQSLKFALGSSLKKQDADVLIVTSLSELKEGSCIEAFYSIDQWNDVTLDQLKSKMSDNGQIILYSNHISSSEAI